MKYYSFYLKTTETCNLNCRHCFTSGTQGAKIQWRVPETIDFIQRFAQHVGSATQVHFEFHGGEPFLVPVQQMQDVYRNTKHCFDSVSYGATTNLVYRLTDEIQEFITGALGNRIGTSWDPEIRFANQKQLDLWHSNVRQLLDAGVTIKLFVSLTRDTLALGAEHLLLWARDLGIQELDLERLTTNGNARQHPDIFPSNLELDQYFLDMHDAITRLNARSWFDNSFMENIYTKFESGVTTAGTFCRDCEQKLFTINADGTVAGCPNSAPEQQFGHIDWDIDRLLTSPQRITNIACEQHRDPRCYDCGVFDVCGSDCHQLAWQGDQCAAPRSLMYQLKVQQPAARKQWIMRSVEAINT